MRLQAKAPPTSASRFQPARKARLRARRGVDHADAWGLSVIVQPIRQGQFLHARHDRACSKARAAANRGGFEENVDRKVRCSAAIMVRRIRVNFGRLRHQIMVG
jgi:hypothetical protein